MGDNVEKIGGVGGIGKQVGVGRLYRWSRSSRWSMGPSTYGALEALQRGMIETSMFVVFYLHIERLLLLYISIAIAILSPN